jgi:tetratricopeptide (TPR) repeat protein
LSAKFQIDLAATLAQPDYVDFLASEVYRAWRDAGGPVAAPVEASLQTPAEFAAGLHEGAAISADECRQAGEKFIAAIRNNSVVDLGVAVDLEAMFDTAIAGLSPLEKERDDLKVAVVPAMGAGILDSRRSISNNGMALGILNVAEKETPPRVRIRWHSDQGFGYLDLRLARRQGIVKAIDTYDLAIGSSVTETQRRTWLPLLLERQSQEFNDRLQGAELESLKHVPAILRLEQCVQSGDGPGAVAAYGTLPVSLQAEKTYMIFWINGSRLVSDDAYAAALEKYRTAFPNDPSLDLVSIDFYFLRNEFDLATACVDRIDTAVGGDPYLDFYRGLCLTGKGALVEARQKFEKLVAAEPNSKDGYDGLLHIDLTTGDFAAVRQRLEEMSAKFQIEVAAKLAQPNYVDFLASDVYRAWREAGGPVAAPPQSP